MKRLAKLIDNGLQVLDQERIVRASGLFDAEWYARTYPDVGGAKAALAHFLGSGSAKGHDPGPKFSTSAYLAANPDVCEAGYNALVHYLRFGRAEGRGVREGSKGPAHPLGTAQLARIAEAFDPDFYAATNPDLKPDDATLAHFLGSGWLERRDPCSWFSLEYYQTAHPDVAETGQNPFVHYLLWGCREARAIQKSRRPRMPPHIPERVGRPRLAALTMVRNEADIIRVFASHLLALFDDIVFVDHLSDDGTGQFLASLALESRKVTVLRLEEPAYIQSVTMTHVVRDLAVLQDADWVFLLDADEFLPFPDRAAFETALTRYARCPVIEMRWQNLVPETYWKADVTLSPDTTFLAPPDLSPFRKVAFQPSRVSLPRTVVTQGNHSLVETSNGLDVPAFTADFPLLHLPVRSVDQLVLKLNQGVEGYRQMGRARDAAHGTHWNQMMRATSSTELTNDILNAVVVRYSEDKPGLVPIPHDRLLTLGHRATNVNIAQSAIHTISFPRRSLGELLMRLHGAPTPDRETRDCPAATRLETTKDGRLIRSLDDRGTEYAELEKACTRTRPCDEVSASTLLARLFSPTYRDIEDLVPSPKAEHIPFLFALADIVRPRRYVELGTLRGAGFLAFCQAARQGDFATEAIAVSGWSVGPEHDHEYLNAFETFTFLTRKYADFAAYLRRDYDSASERFAEGSVDLLHLDGFCDEEPLRRTLDTWLPKLSSRGILLVHDVNAHVGSSGVWRVWEDLADRYPALHFPHALGLGMACIGTDAAPEAAELCRMFRQDRHQRVLLWQHFEQMGRLSNELFSRRYDMAQGEARARSDGAQAEELSWLRQELDSLRTDNDQLRKLLKGNIAHALSG